jgi:GNAT superfamily N-acetyltransferase
MFVKKFNENDWQVYKAIRLEALSRHEDVYGGSFAGEAALGDDYWQDALARDEQAFFGLYDKGILVGSAGVYTDRDDKTGRTAKLVGGYIREAYRGQGLSRLLYEARIGWIVQSGLFDCITVGHKKGNDRSRGANQNAGFEFVGSEDTVWGDGSLGLLMRYEMRI